MHLPQVLRRVPCDAPCDEPPVGVEHAHDVALVEVTLDARDAHGQKRRAALLERLGRAPVDRDRAARHPREADPELARLLVAGARRALEARGAALAVDRVDERAAAPPPADDHGDAGRDHGPAGTDLRGHAARAKGAAHTTGHGDDIGVDALHALEQAGVGVRVGVCRVQAVDVGEDHVEVGVDERGHDGAEHVVVAEGELAHANRVVLVHDG